MFKFAIILAAGLALAAPAMAQETAPPPAKAESAPAAPAAKAPPTPVSGVVVQAPKLKACGYRDKACQAQVIAEIWRRYPEKVETWCTAIQTRRTRERFAMEDILGGGSGLSQLAGANFNTALPEPEQAICRLHGQPPTPERPFVGKDQAAASTAATKAAPPSGANAK